MINAVIIDDENRSINVLKKMLLAYCPEVSVIGTSDDPYSAVALIEQKKPNLVFLDIRMPGLNGFEVLDHFDEPEFKIVFTTAYDTHAMKAIKYAAMDYLLKPIGIEELKEVVVRYTAYKNKMDAQLLTMAQQLNVPQRQSGNIGLRTSQGYLFIETKDIMWIQASSAYSVFHLANGQKHTSSSNLKKFEDMLENRLFLRIHHSFLVNIEHIRKYTKSKNACVTLTDGTKLEVSQRRKGILEAYIDGGLHT